MRLIKQSSLYFKEGNSDKVYEIDLCDAGNQKYVVNFRYGRRYSVLKEGTKTPVPVSLDEAERIFNSVEDEKIAKGYSSDPGATTSAVRAAAKTVVLQETVADPTLAGWEQMLPGREKSIVGRLHAAANGVPSPAKKAWKLSRAIWKAGQYKIPEAGPYIIRLFDKGDLLHQYCCTWSLVRCGGPSAVTSLQTLFREHPSAAVKKMAGAGLLRLLQGDDLERHAQHYQKQLPEPMQEAIREGNLIALNELTGERSEQLQPQYNWIESLYLLSLVRPELGDTVYTLLLSLPVKPGYFKHVRAVFKLSELLDDHRICGMLAYRFEKEVEGFVHYIPASEPDTEVWVPTTEEWIKPRRELLKKNSRVAYSQKTRWYLHRRMMRRLEMLRNTGNAEYVRLATAILVSYDDKTDIRNPFVTSEYKYQNGRYTRLEISYPRNAHAIFLHWLIDPRIDEFELKGHLWRSRIITEKPQGRPATVSVNVPPRPRRRLRASPIGLIIWLLLTGYDYLNQWQKKRQLQARAAAANKPVAANEPVAGIPKGDKPAANKSGDPIYRPLWDQQPEAYIILLIEGRMEEIHSFALDRLRSHPSIGVIEDGLTGIQLEKLLLSDYDSPAAFGYQVVKRRYAGRLPETGLLAAMIDSRHSEAKQRGKELTTENLATLLTQADFVKSLIFARDPEVRSWARNLLRNQTLSVELRQAVTGKSVAEMMHIRDAAMESILQDASGTLLEMFIDRTAAPIAVISDLLIHPLAAVQLFALRWLQEGQAALNISSLSKTFLFGLLQHPNMQVREMGLLFLQKIEPDLLIQYGDSLIAACLSPYRDIRQGIGAALALAAAKEAAFGERAADILMPYLVRKETAEGLHEDLSRLLQRELSDYLKGADKDLALRLLYSHYLFAQNLGVVILDKYTDPSQLTIPQVVALGNHENVVLRTWSWKFYRGQSKRILLEQEKSIRMLESKWSDTRQFAIGYFREQFQEQDWTAETLITLADSVKPDVEAFGRELITRSFNDEHGPQYLLTLSQHPGTNMQLFASNYLDLYAGDNDERIFALEYYFRSVLTRVNKSRITRNRVLAFLLKEGKRSESVARFAANILSDLSATAAIGDKAACIEVLLQLRSLYDVATPMQIHEIETRAYNP